MKVQSHPWEVYLNQFRNKQVRRHALRKKYSDGGKNYG